jgi:hypothetical protein
MPTRDGGGGDSKRRHVAETITSHVRSSGSDTYTATCTLLPVLCAQAHRGEGGTFGCEPSPLMQGQAVAKLAMEASRRHFLHEPRRHPQSTFIVVRHLHFLGNRGFGVRNELCSHIDYSPLSLGFKRRRCVSRGLAAVENRILAYRRTAVFPPFRGVTPPAECGRGEPPPTGVLCGLLSPQCQRARWTATRRAAR